MIRFSGRKARAAALAGVAALSLLILSPVPAAAQWAVFDANNFAQNLLIAARELKQIDNEITSLQNQSQMLINQAHNLANLPYSSLTQLTASLQRTQTLLGQAQGLTYNVGAIQTQFGSVYPSGYTGTGSSAQMLANAQARWLNALSGFQDALKTQATVVGNLPTVKTQGSALVTSSQGAAGALQASQAGNQMLALISQQLGDITALLAAEGRAQSLEGARGAGDIAQGRAQLQQFITPGAGYQPTAITMFH
jgi:P-type conjugative transfer protein TrbJ